MTTTSDMCTTFQNAYPDYLLDREIIINDTHKHKVSGFKLALVSDYFREKIKNLHSKEIERLNPQIPNENSDLPKMKRRRTRSVSEIEKDKLKIYYDDLIGLEMALSFAHFSDEECNDLSKLTDENLLSTLRAGLFFQMPHLIEYCFNYVEESVDANKCWLYWRMSLEIKERLPDFFYKIRRYILEYFLIASYSDEVKNISLEELTQILKDDELNCGNELDLLPMICSWVEGDEKNRAMKFPLVLQCLRLGRIKTCDLQKFTNNRFLQQNLDQCQQLIELSRLSLEEILIQKPISMKGFSNTAEEIAMYMQSPRLPREAIFVIGGWEGHQDDPANFGPSKSVQVFDPRANTWQRYTSNAFALNEGHAYSGCVVHDNRIYIVGGYTNAGPTQTLKMFDFNSKQWKFLAPMHEKRNYISCCVLDDFIYALGGHNGDERLKSAEKYDVKSGMWILMQSMIHVRSDAGSAAVNGNVYVCGGFDGQTYYSSMEMHISEGDFWTLVIPMNEIRSGVSMVSVGKYLYVLGGNNGQYRLNSVERYNPQSNRWTSMPTMIGRRSNFCVTVMEGEIYAIGGWSDESNSTIGLVEKWSPEPSKQWSLLKEMPAPASANCCCTVVGLENILEHLNRY